MSNQEKSPAEQPDQGQQGSPLVTFGDEALNASIPPPPEEGAGARIREARLRPAYDLSIEALSRLCKEYDRQGQGITSTTLLRYEQGKVLPGAREIRVLCDALDVSSDWLLFGVENPMDITLSEGLALLRDVIEDRQSHLDPLRRRRGAIDMVRDEKIRLAKVPQKR